MISQVRLPSSLYNPSTDRVLNRRTSSLVQWRIKYDGDGVSREPEGVGEEFQDVWRCGRLDWVRRYGALYRHVRSYTRDLRWREEVEGGGGELGY